MEQAIHPGPGEAEHGALLRMWGRLQTRLSAQCLAQAQTLAGLQAEVLRLRAELMLTRTAVWWGLAAGHAVRPMTRPTARYAARPV